ncbi:MAG: DUF7521 family protein [Halobacteriota archaeon]
MASVAVGVVAVKTLILVLGGLVTLMTYRAYRRTGFQPLRSLCIGFAFVTLGALLGGAVHNLTEFDIVTGVLVESALVAVGFAVITYSMYFE